MPFKKRNTTKNMIGFMFLSSAVVMILTQVIGLVAIIIDGVITSRMLGTDAYSAISLLQPFVLIVLMFAGLLSVGNQVICSRFVGEGKEREANEALSAAMTMAIIFLALLLSFCIFMPDTLLRVCGVSVEQHPDFYNPMIEYLRGYMLAIPAMLFIQIMGPVIVLDNNKSLFTASAVLLCVADIAGDFLNVLVFKGGTFGMGLATTVSFYLQGLFLLTHFFRKDSYFRLSFQRPSPSAAMDIIKNGFPAFVTRLATALQNLFVSRFNLAVALTAAAVAAKGIQGDVNNFMFCFSLGLGRATMGLSSLYYGGKDMLSLKKLFKYAGKASGAISLIVGLIIFICSPVIAGIYTSDPEVKQFAVFGICCMTAGLVFDAITTAYMDYLQGTGKRKLVNVLVFFERFFVPIFTAYILGKRYGSSGVLASLAISKLIMVFVIWIAVVIYRKKAPTSYYDLMLLPDDFGGREEDNLHAHVETIDDVMKECIKVEDFCGSHGITERKSKAMALALEELAVNVISHGRKMRFVNYGVDYWITIDQKEITLTVRDLCEYFNPVTWQKMHISEDPEKGLGLRIVTGIAKEVRYFNAFNSNNIVFRLDRGEANETD